MLIESLFPVVFRASHILWYSALHDIVIHLVNPLGCLLSVLLGEWCLLQSLSLLLLLDLVSEGLVFASIFIVLLELLVVVVVSWDVHHFSLCRIVSNSKLGCRRGDVFRIRLLINTSFIGNDIGTFLVLVHIFSLLSCHFLVCLLFSLFHLFFLWSLRFFFWDLSCKRCTRLQYLLSIWNAWFEFNSVPIVILCNLFEWV